jgi:hypothetical protein
MSWESHPPQAEDSGSQIVGPLRPVASIIWELVRKSNPWANSQLLHQTQVAALQLEFYQAHMEFLEHTKGWDPTGYRFQREGGWYFLCHLQLWVPISIWLRLLIIPWSQAGWPRSWECNLMWVSVLPLCLTHCAAVLERLADSLLPRFLPCNME